MRKKKKESSAEESYYLASQWQLMWRKFVRHKLALAGGSLLAVLYLVAIFSGFFATQAFDKYDKEYINTPPQRIHFFDEDGDFHLRPFVYGIERRLDPDTFQRIYWENYAEKYPVHFFARGDEYKLWNLFETNIHFLGVENPGVLLIFGTDKLGRDLFSRTIAAARISLSIGLVGVGISFVLGLILGGISGYYGGTADMIIQRIIEFLMSIPGIPLWMALSAALPRTWSPMKIYFFITLILSIQGWTGLARVVRGKILQLREEDFAMAAKIAGASEGRIITRHLLPSFMSYLIVNLTLAVPMMILAETALSFLGLGLRPPVVSWGVLLAQAQNVETIAMYYWLLIPGIFVIVTVLLLNFLGDGLRDAADPYK